MRVFILSLGGILVFILSFEGHLSVYFEVGGHPTLFITSMNWIVIPRLGTGCKQGHRHI